MSNGEIVEGEDMCPRFAKMSPKGRGKFICAGLFMGQCKLIRRMVNLVDTVISEDGHFAGMFDQALWQIIALRYPELNLRVDSEMKYFQNWNDMGKEAKKKWGAETELFQDMFGVTEDEICAVTGGSYQEAGDPKRDWEWEDFAKKFGSSLLFVHFNGDAKVPLMTRCLANTLKTQTEGVEGAKWVSPDLEVVMNCDSKDDTDYGVFKKDISKRLSKHSAMKDAWYKKFPYAYNMEPCTTKDFVRTCPPDETKGQGTDPNRQGHVVFDDDKGMGAYAWHPEGPILSASRGPTEEVSSWWKNDKDALGRKEWEAEKRAAVAT